MHVLRRLSPFFLLVTLAACAPRGQQDIPYPLPSDGQSSSVDAVVVPGGGTSAAERETGNVTYRGIVEPLGISLYMQGTHRLALEDDRFILLEGPAVDLSGYLGEEIEVYGAVRPTVEGNNVIMRVERVTRLRSSVSSLTLEIPSSRSSSTVSTISTASRAVSSFTPIERDARVAAMEKETFGAAQWTQEYCSTHIGFCIPIHRNWWFKSFGATSSSLWHVEVSMEPVENLGDGPLLINLVSGEVGAVGAKDLEVRMHGNFAVGYRAWADGRHFEVSAPVELKEAVQYMTEHLR